MGNDCSGGNDQSIVEFRARKVLGFCFGLKRLRRPRAPASDRGASPGDFEGHIPSMLVHPMIPSDLPSGLLPLLARRRLSLETPKSIALAGSQPSVSRRRPEVLICIKASALGFAIAGIAAYRSMPRSSPMPDSISSLSLRTCSCRLSTAGEQAFGASEGVLARYALQSQSGSRESGALERRMARDQASAFGVVGREGWLDCSCRSQDHGSSNAGLPANHSAGHRTFDESRIAALYGGIFGAWFGGLPGNEVAI